MIRNRFAGAKNNEHRRGAIMILAAAMLVVSDDRIPHRRADDLATVLPQTGDAP